MDASNPIGEDGWATCLEVALRGYDEAWAFWRRRRYLGHISRLLDRQLDQHSAASIIAEARRALYWANQTSSAPEDFEKVRAEMDVWIDTIDELPPDRL